MGDLTKFTATTCKPVQDHSAYWVPTLYDAATGKPVETTGFRVYYRSLMGNSTGQMPMPNGLRMISGDAQRSPKAAARPSSTPGSRAADTAAAPMPSDTRPP